MKILLVSDAYPPEIRSASHLMQELAEKLRDRGHAVTVATCYPEYNLAEAASADEYEECSLEAGIRVIRIRTLPHHKVNFIIRGLSQLSLPYIFWFKIKPYLKDGVDVVLVYSPPLPLWKVGDYIKKNCGAKFILNVQDIFPQNAIDLDVLHNPLLIRLFERMEKKAYDRADSVTVHSNTNGLFLLRNKKTTAEKLLTVHNWVDLDLYEETKQKNVYRSKLGIENAFIFFFGGVLGPSQGLDLLIDVAKEVQKIEDIVFLLMGDGAEKARLMLRVQQEKLTNVHFHPFISKDEYKELLKEVDVGLVCLSPKNKTPVVPGKILGYMAVGVPVLAFLNRESDGHQIIRDARCGYSSISDDVSNAVKSVLRMYNEKNGLKEVGFNGYQYATENFSKQVCVDKLESLF